MSFVLLYIVNDCKRIFVENICREYYDPNIRRFFNSDEPAILGLNTTK